MGRITRNRYSHCELQMLLKLANDKHPSLNEGDYPWRLAQFPLPHPI